MYKYWNNFYKSFKVNKPSKFAIFCLRYLKPKTSIIDLGCGNGRDSIFFSKKGFTVVGVDKSNIIKNIPIDVSLNFIQGDFTKLNNSSFDNVYSRFSLHSISKKEELRVLKWVYCNIKKGVFCIEVRSINDSLYGKGHKVEKDAFIYTHYRRFIRKNELERRLKRIGFEIIYSKEDINFAPYKNENPKIIRIICLK